MGRLYNFWHTIRRHKYAFVIGVFALLIGVVDENSFWSRYRHKTELAELRSEIRKYSEMYDHDTRYLEEMNTNPGILTEIARERYYMKTGDEDIFVIGQKDSDEDAE
ncbi:MAG: septum formation initiator family protein [Paraprevotella sp.]|nr:septum formation initiator family protein [Paraprevotella sp.]